MHEEIYRLNQRGENRDLIRFEMCGTTFPDKSYEIRRDHSRIACIEYIDEGSGTVILDGKKFYPCEGDSYFLQSKKDQHYYSDKSRPWKKYFINISGRLAESLAEAYGLSDVSHFEALDLKDELLRIIEIGKRNGEDCTAELIGILNEIFLKMRAHKIKSSEQGDVATETKMRDFLNTQITSKFNLELLCKHVSRSESQTIRTFKKAFGMTPYAYVLKRKIDFSKRLLVDTNLTVRQISDKLCFADEYYFSNVFKNKVGMTPTSYRKSYNK